LKKKKEPAMRNRLLCPAALLCLAALLVVGCGTSDPSAPTPDAGTADQLVTTPDGAASPDGASPDGAAGTCPSGASFDVTLRKVRFSALVDGKGPYNLIYDTGSPATWLSPKITGGIPGLLHKVTSIDLGGGVKLGPVDASTASMPYYMDGIIGNDAMGKRAVSVDYLRRQLWVSDKVHEADLLACTHLQGKPARTTMTVAPYPFVQGEVDGVKGTLLVDTGASLGGVEQDVLDATGKGNPQVEGYKMTYSLGTKTFWSGYAMVGQMRVGKHAVKRITMYTMPDEELPAPTASGSTMATLPYGFMQHFLVTLDFSTMQLRLDAGKAAKLKDDFTLYGYGLSLSTAASGPVTVTRVIKGSPADTSGVEKGDTVKAIDGADPATTAPEGRIKLVLTGAAGIKRSFKLERAGAATVHDLTSAELFAGFAP
jgi:hypothetical protein